MHQIDLLQLVLDRFCAGQSPFVIELDGYGHFRKDVVYINVRKDDKLMDFRRKLVTVVTAANLLELPKISGQYIPHLTLANRDLKEEYFKMAWEQFRDEPFHAHFQLANIVLYRHDGEIWKEEVLFGF